MKRYERYKYSGVEWLGEIPIEWNLKDLKYIANIFNGSTPKDEDRFWDGEIYWFTPSDLGSLNGSKITYESKRKITKLGLDSCGCSLIPAYSLILTTRAPIGNVAISKFNFATNQGCKSIVSGESLSTDFLYYYILSAKLELENLGSGSTFKELSSHSLADFKIAFPSLSEQFEIASYLDLQTTLIDNLIQKTQRKIELLKEQRTSIINRAVTQGLEPNVSMKYSGVGWIGDIPQHWIITKLKFISEFVTDGSHFSPTTKPQGKYYVTVTNITENNDIDFNSCKKISEDSFSQLQKNGCQPQIGDVLITKDGTIGRGVVVGEFNDFVILSSIGLIRPDKIKLNSEYLLYYLLSDISTKQMHSRLRGSGITRLTINLIDDLFINVPPIDEQCQIVTAIKSSLNIISETIIIEEKKNALLKQYRQSFIYEVITGKIDVRNETITI